MKKIKFIPNSQDAYDKLDAPKPASKSIPDWYRLSTKFIGGKMEIKEYGINKDLKLCVPFLDSLLAGYQIELVCDLVVRKNQDGSRNFSWAEEPEPIAFRSSDIASTLPRPYGHTRQMYAWKTSWGFKTPKGYSTLITHPFNRFDLPFMTTSGIMDTDEYSLGGEVPFFLNESFEGIIPAGTPILQALPFKRDGWKSQKEEFKDGWVKRQAYLVNKVVYGGYKKLMWHRKLYK